MTDDTIAAISTPIGEGGIAIIRVSGPQSLAIADKLFSSRKGKPSSFPTHTIHFGQIVRAGNTIDHAMLSVMRAPHSYTTEDTVEFNCHGGMLIARAVLTLCLESGARHAEPGEFTKRALLNGRLDLAQAEAVMDLISAKTERSQVAATHALEGHLSRQVEIIRERLLSVLAHIEAQIDFPEDDLAPATRDKLINEVEEICHDLEKLLATSRHGKILRQGVTVAIVGRPNAGKSSLMNALLGQDRSIVSAIPGTTRDTIEDYVDIRGIPVRLIDTAGIRATRTTVERLGVKRSHKSILMADLVLHVIDKSRPFSNSEIKLSSAYKNIKSIIVINKIDLKQRLKLTDKFTHSHVINLSCRTGDGLEDLKEVIERVIWRGELNQSCQDVTVNDRHAHAIRRTLQFLRSGAIELKSNNYLEIVAQHYRNGLDAIGEIVGKTSTEDILGKIFSTFCIGK